jgi:hypothetical protein
MAVSYVLHELCCSADIQLGLYFLRAGQMAWKKKGKRDRQRERERERERENERRAGVGQ